MVLTHLKLKIPQMAATEVGIPPPLQLWDFESIMLSASPIAAAPSMSRGSSMGFARTASYTEADIWIISSASILKVMVISAAKKPVATEKTRQGKIRLLICLLYLFFIVNSTDALL